MKRLLIAAAGVLLLLSADVSAQQPGPAAAPGAKPTAPGTPRRIQIRPGQGRPRQPGRQIRRGQPTPRQLRLQKRLGGPRAGRAPNLRLRQPGHRAAPNRGHKPSHAGHGHARKPDSRELGNSKAMALLFWLFALGVVAGAIFVITRKNLIVAVMGMVATFFAIAAVFAMLFAHFLAVIQVLVYAGAIMVLFVFVIMILNRPEDEPYGKSNWVGRGLALAASGYLLFRLSMVLWSFKPVNPAAGLAPGKNVLGVDFGSTEAVGTTLFGKYLFPFEAVSLVLLIAVVGAIAVARPHAKRETLGAQPDTGEADAAGAE